MLVLAASASAQSVDIRGVWALDAAASDTLELTKSDTAFAARPRFRLGLGGWYGGFPPQSRSIRDPRRMRDAVDAVGDPAENIVILQDDSTVTISFDAAPPLTVFTDGRKEHRAWRDRDGVKVRARWDDGALRIERELESQVEIVETYRRDGDVLTITSVVEGPILRRIELRRVYDRVQGR
jgi:hypothetical protein